MHAPALRPDVDVIIFIHMISVKSEYYSIFLKIADINIQLNIQQKKELLFLKKKYEDYLCDDKKSENILIDIVCSSSSRVKQLVKKSDKNFLIYTTSIIEKFANFNDVFLQAFIDIFLIKWMPTHSTL